MSALKTAKKIAKNAGKAALTIVCPPLGLATFKYSHRKDRSFASGLATAASCIFAVGYNIISEQTLSDEPIVNIETRPNNAARTLIEMPTSPLLFWLDSHTETRVKEQEIARVYGDKVITFSPSTERYSLNFDETTRFDLGTFGGYVSLAEARQRVGELANNSRGNAIAGRDYLKVQKDYDAARNIFANAVERMNQRIDLGLENKTGAEKQ